MSNYEIYENSIQTIKELIDACGPVNLIQIKKELQAQVLGCDDEATAIRCRNLAVSNLIGIGYVKLTRENDQDVVYPV